MFSLNRYKLLWIFLGLYFFVFLYLFFYSYYYFGCDTSFVIKGPFDSRASFLLRFFVTLLTFSIFFCLGSFLVILYASFVSFFLVFPLAYLPMACTFKNPFFTCTVPYNHFCPNNRTSQDMKKDSSNSFITDDYE